MSVSVYFWNRENDTFSSFIRSFTHPFIRNFPIKCLQNAFYRKKYRITDVIPQHNVRFSCDASLANSIYWNKGKTRTISKFSFFNYTTVVYVHLCEFTAKFHCLKYGYFAVVTFTTPRLPRRSGIMSCAFTIEYALAMEFPLSWKINWISKYCCCWCSQVSSNIPWWYILRKKHVVWLIDWWIFCCSHCTAFAFEKLAAPTQTKWVRWE